MWSKISHFFTKYKSLWIVLLAWRIWTMIPIFLAPLWLPLRTEYIALYSFFGSRWPIWITTWANFDGENYLTIARRGYWPGGVPFFPLYPILVRLVYDRSASIRTLTAGLIVSYVCFGLSIIVVHKLLKLDKYKFSLTWFYLIWLLFPTSAFYTAAYNDALFFLCACLTLYWSRQGKWLWAGVAGGLATLARLNGMALGVYMAVEYLQFAFPIAKTWNYKQWGKQFLAALQPMRIWQSMIWAGLLIPLSFIGYLAYIQYQFGNWHLLFEAMAPWQQDKIVFPLVVFWRYFKIFLTVPFNTIPFGVAALEFSAVILYLVVIIASIKKIRFSYWVFMVISFLIPSLTGTFQGMPRYGLHLYPFFLALVLLLMAQPKKVRYVYILVCLIITTAVIGLFAQGFFVT